MHKKIRPPRVEESEEFHFEDGGEHSWAVSYADFLMVLLSFFILFFSVDADKKDSIIERILTDSRTGIGSESGAGSANQSQGGTAQGRQPLGIASEASLPSLEGQLKNYQFSYQKKEQELIVHLPDNIFKAGALNMDLSHQSVFEQLLTILEPYRTQIDLVIIGHTDHEPVRRVKSRVIADNLDVSVMRAAKAVQMALRRGWAPENLAAKGSSHWQRSTRSLSFVIREKTNL